VITGAAGFLQVSTGLSFLSSSESNAPTFVPSLPLDLASTCQRPLSTPSFVIVAISGLGRPRFSTVQHPRAKKANPLRNEKNLIKRSSRSSGLQDSVIFRKALENYIKAKQFYRSLSSSRNKNSLTGSFGRCWSNDDLSAIGSARHGCGAPRRCSADTMFDRRSIIGCCRVRFASSPTFATFEVGRRRRSILPQPPRHSLVRVAVAHWISRPLLRAAVELPMPIGVELGRAFRPRDDGATQPLMPACRNKPTPAASTHLPNSAGQKSQKARSHSTPPS